MIVTSHKKSRPNFAEIDPAAFENIFGFLFMHVFTLIDVYCFFVVSA
jgi:hypothetical protein